MSEGKRIVHISTVHSWQDPRIFLKQCRSLAKHGFNVHLITPDGPNKKVEGVQVHRLRFKAKNRLSRFLFASQKIFKQALEFNPSIIHFHDPELIPTALKIKRKTDAHLIYDIHEDNTTSIMQREYLPKFIKPIIIFSINYFEKKAAKKLPTIIAESYYSRRFPQAQPILNFPDLEWMEEKKKESVYPSLIYTGNVREDRGALNHAEILNYTEGVEVWCIGRCEAKLYEQMLNKTSGQHNRLIVKGIDEYIPFEQIKAQYKSRNWLAGLALFPFSEHVKEKHLTKFFEYMAAGIPILYSDIEEWSQLLGPLEVGIAVNPEDKNSIKAAIQKLQKNPELHRKMGENGQRAVKERFSWSGEEEKLVKFYESL